MAEAVGLAASLASLIEISGRVVAAGYGYISKVANAPSRMRMVLSEVSSVNLVLGRLEENLTTVSTPTSTSVLDALSRIGVFEDCSNILRQIDSTVQICMAEGEAHSSKHDVKAVLRRAIWPMKEKETEEVLKHLDRLRSVLSDAIVQDSTASLYRLEEMTQKLHQTTTEMANTQHHAALMAWVCPYSGDPFDNYQAALKRRQPGTGGWLTESDSFKTWSQNDHGIFWLRGLPGCGKSVLISIVIEYMQYSWASKDIGIALAYFYIDYRDPAKQTLDACLGTLVRQLLDHNPQGIERLERLSEQKQRSLSRNLTTSEYIGLLADVADFQSKVYIVIDALDEAPYPQAFVDALKQLSDRECGTPVAVLVSSRNDAILENLLMPVVTHNVFVSNEDNDDVRMFVAAKVNKKFTSRKLNVPNSELINSTISKIVARADGLFLQADLLLDFVFARGTSRSIRNALTELPNGLEETYETILRKTTSQNRYHVSEIKKSLQWLSMSLVPLTPAMLVEAAAIDPDDHFLDPEAIMDEVELIGMLSSLVLVDWNLTPPVVGLAHKTVLEYLQSESILQSDMSQYHVDARKTNQYLAETSIQYLSFPESAKSLMRAARFLPKQNALQSEHHDPLETAARLAEAPNLALELTDHHLIQVSSILQQHSEMHYHDSSLGPDVVAQPATRFDPCLMHACQEQALLNYVANLWPEHMKSGEYTNIDFTKTIVPRLQWYLNPREDSGILYEAWEAFQRRRLSGSLFFVGPFRCYDQQLPLFRQLLKSSYFNYIGHETTQDPFFYTVLFGLDDCFSLLKSQYDVDMTFRGGWTPLTVAAASGSLSIAEKLLGAGANVNEAADMDERNGLTPLHIAAELAMEDLVKLFLKHGASIISLTATLTTPFYRAARGGSIQILKLLHEAGSDVNAPSWDDYIPLMEAVSCSNHDALELLLSWGADPKFQNRHGQSATDFALMVGDESVVAKLREAPSKHTSKPVNPETICYRDKMTKERFFVE
ncbi:MAG: hypothetical protein ALECFALPRED_009973 [Alectoria fallacina]|uniref:Nephrocystin 3-like N-terminal domain-containing protein n=1 Tax=Alectoria fallacina TaxID=1903189 RepID=A0A8H3IE32_9LECA|nr:MAG: hypothetical protein ALECFALPRED_009973 [Alectoria fallacina]